MMRPQPCRAHERGGAPAQVEGGDEIGAEEPAYIIKRESVETAAIAHAGIVHEDVEAGHLRKRRRTRRRIGDIEGERLGRSAERPHLGGQLLERLKLPSVDQHMGAACGEPFDDFRPKAAPASRHQRDAAVQVKGPRPLMLSAPAFGIVVSRHSIAAELTAGSGLTRHVFSW